MSRAFTKENDGWCYCIKEQESCMFADETGACALAECKKDKGKNAAGKKEMGSNETVPS